MSDNNTKILEIKEKIAKFTSERNWNQFHTPKSLSMSIAIEAAELMEKFQWHDNQSSFEAAIRNKQEIEEEIADIACYVFSFCNATGIDLTKAIIRKMEINAKKYPVDKCKGKSDKYTDL